MKIALKKVNCHGMPLWERLLARLIDRCTGGSGVFHCELLFSDGKSFTADPIKGVTIWRHDWTPGGWIFFDLGRTDELLVRAAARRECGQRYDFGGCISCWLPWVKHWRAHKYCSLAVNLVLRFRRKFPVIPGTRVSPNDLLRLCQRVGYRVSDVPK